MSSYYLPGTVLGTAETRWTNKKKPSSRRNYILTRETGNEFISHEAGDHKCRIAKESRVRGASIREQTGHSGSASLRGWHWAESQWQEWGTTTISALTKYAQTFGGGNELGALETTARRLMWLEWSEGGRCHWGRCEVPAMEVSRQVLGASHARC